SVQAERELGSSTSSGTGDSQRTSERSGVRGSRAGSLRDLPGDALVPSGWVRRGEPASVGPLLEAVPASVGVALVVASVGSPGVTLAGSREGAINITLAPETSNTSRSRLQ